MTWHHIVWSMDNAPSHPYTLHSGLQTVDWSKPFWLSKLDNWGFRLRQFSHFFDMVSFKFWQGFEMASFKNYTLVFLHILNTVLVGLLVRHMTKSLPAALFSGLFFLNSAAGISTLLFPFRSAKPLVAAFFLLAWLIIAREEKGFSALPAFRKLLVFALMALALFTDEFAVILFPLLFIYVFLRDGSRGIFNKQLWRYVVITIGVCVILAKVFFYFSQSLEGPVPAGHLSAYWQSFKSYFSGIHILTDTFRALLFSFLRRNFGYMDATLPGGLAAAATAVLIYLIFRFRLSDAFLKKILCTILAMLLVKAFVFPHPGGVHPYIMPAGTVFPSLLFFNQYYTYIDAIFLALMLGIGLTPAASAQKKSMVILLALVTLISFSNARHKQEGIRDMVKFHEGYLPSDKTAAAILSIKDYLRKTKPDGPLYLSFPSGSDAYFVRDSAKPYPQARAEGLDMNFYDYASIVPVMYLRAFERGEARMSLRNVPSAHQGLEGARLFLDVPSRRILNLDLIRENFGAGALENKTLSHFQKEFALGNDPAKLVFFIKDAAWVTLVRGDKEVYLNQSYGYAYQLFGVTLSRQESRTLSVTIEPWDKDKTFSLIGPFLLPAK